MLQILLVACMALIQDPQPKAYDLGAARELKVLFAGTQGEPREKAFESLLGQAFDRVDTIDLRKLSAESAKGYDVVVADWEPTYRDGRWGQGERHGVKLERDFPTPLLMIGDLAGSLVSATKFRHL